MKLGLPKRIVLYALLAWLGGLGCFAGCIAETYAAPAASAAGDCADDCCKKGQSGSEHSEHPASKMDCCLYLTTPPATVGKKTTDGAPQAYALVAVAREAAPERLVPVAAPRPPIFDSSGDYLRNRVLRI